MVVDEAAYMNDEVWKAVLRPIMLVRGKKVLFISTPRGSNWFKEHYDLGQSTDPETSDYSSCRMHYTDNPFVDPQEIENARLTLPQSIFAAEYEGSFEDSGRGVFDLSNTKTFDSYPKPQGKVYCGIDLGRSVDYTVATFIDSNGQVVGMYRENSKDWSGMVQDMLKLIKQFNATVLVEKNSIGDVIHQQIKDKWRDTHPFNTSNKSKQEIIEGLVLDLNESALTLPSEELFPPLLFELSVYEYSYSPKTRSITFNAPSGLHDDVVMSLAIANYHRKQNVSYGTYATLGGSPNNRY
jgi:hypothetical protein